MTYFKDKPNAPDLTHNCCDAWCASCQCVACSSKDEHEEASKLQPTLSRQVEEDDRKFLSEMFKEIPSKTGPVSSVFGSARLSEELDQEVIESQTTVSTYFQLTTL